MKKLVAMLLVVTLVFGLSPQVFAVEGAVSGELDIGIPAPVSGATPVTTVTGENYSGTIFWGG